MIRLSLQGKPMRRALPVGSRVPAAALLDPEGTTVALDQLLSSGRSLLYFYPRAHTPYCTRQACNLRDHRQELAHWGVRVVGVSGDSPKRLASFRQRWALPFLLLSDPRGSVARAFGLPVFLGLAKRASFLIEDGIVVWRDLHPQVGSHAQDLLQMLALRPRPPVPAEQSPDGGEPQEHDPDRSPGSWPSAG